jgi:uncharacterized damage-inducible protein DinB
MSEATSIADELKEIHDGNAWHGPALQESLAGLTIERAAARPIPDAHSIWEIVAHIAGWEDVICQRLEGKPLTQPEEGDFPAPDEVSEAAWARTLARLNETHERLLETIAHLSDADLDKVTAGKDYSVRKMLRGAIHHHVYHAGQIALLRKAFT